MKASEPNSNSVNLNDTMIKIIQTLENLKIKRDKINQDLEEGYQLREKIQQQLNLYGEQLQKVTDDDSRPTAALCMDVQAGLYIGKKFSIGYQANFHSQGDCYIKHTDHMLRLALDF